jgi:hypothetical protein
MNYITGAIGHQRGTIAAVIIPGHPARWHNRTEGFDEDEISGITSIGTVQGATK